MTGKININYLNVNTTFDYFISFTWFAISYVINYKICIFLNKYFWEISELWK